MFNKKDTGLIVVDIQGKLAQIVHDSEAFISNTVKLIKGARALELPIVWLEQNPAKLGKTDPAIAAQLMNQSPISKMTFNGCLTPAVLSAVRSSGVSNWLVCGIETHICVYQTCMDLQRHNFSIEVVTNCVSSRALVEKELALEKMKSKGIGITSLEMCLYELTETCEASEFSQILSLIK